MKRLFPTRARIASTVKRMVSSYIEAMAAADPYGMGLGQPGLWTDTHTPAATRNYAPVRIAADAEADRHQRAL